MRLRKEPAYFAVDNDTVLILYGDAAYLNNQPLKPYSRLSQNGVLLTVNLEIHGLWSYRPYSL